MRNRTLRCPHGFALGIVPCEQCVPVRRLAINDAEVLRVVAALDRSDAIAQALRELDMYPRRFRELVGASAAVSQARDRCAARSYAAAGERKRRA